MTPDGAPPAIGSGENVPDTDEPGWRVLDAGGNVVASGPGVALEAAALAGEEQ